MHEGLTLTLLLLAASGGKILIYSYYIIGFDNHVTNYEVPKVSYYIFLFILAISLRFQGNRSRLYQLIFNVHWEKIFAEPDGVKSVECMWKVSYKIYEATKWVWYNALVAIFFIPLSLIWGIRFACMSFMHVWIWVPLHKSMLMTWYLVRDLMTLICESISTPLFYTIGACFSRCRITQNYDSKPMRPFDSDIYKV